MEQTAAQIPLEVVAAGSSRIFFKNNEHNENDNDDSHDDNDDDDDDVRFLSLSLRPDGHDKRP